MTYEEMTAEEMKLSEFAAGMMAMEPIELTWREVLEQYLSELWDRLYELSGDYLMTRPKRGYVREWAIIRAKINMAERKISEEQTVK